MAKYTIDTAKEIMAKEALHSNLERAEFISEALYSVIFYAAEKVNKEGFNNSIGPFISWLALAYEERKNGNTEMDKFLVTGGEYVNLFIMALTDQKAYKDVCISVKNLMGNNAKGLSFIKYIPNKDSVYYTVVNIDGNKMVETESGKALNALLEANGVSVMGLDRHVDWDKVYNVKNDIIRSVNNIGQYTSQGFKELSNMVKTSYDSLSYSYNRELDYTKLQLDKLSNALDRYFNKYKEDIEDKRSTLSSAFSTIGRWIITFVKVAIGVAALYGGYVAGKLLVDYIFGGKDDYVAITGTDNGSIIDTPFFSW